MEQAQVVVLLFSAEEFKTESKRLKVEIEKIKNRFPLKPLLVIANKIDVLNDFELKTLTSKFNNLHLLSAKTGLGVDELKNKLISFVNTGALRNNETIVTNTRHYDSLIKAFEEINNVKAGLETGVSGDLLAIDVRQALFHFGEITGEITSDDLLGNIFANFCIGK